MEPPKKFISKRPHTKSRGRCGTCRRKKIKCDEMQPECTYCRDRDLECRYNISHTGASSSQRELVPKKKDESCTSIALLESRRTQEAKSTGRPVSLSNSLSPPVVSSTGTHSMTDLRLLHHYTMYTASNLSPSAPGDYIARIKIPVLAFKNDFLMSGMLGLAAFHKHRLLPHDKELQRLTFFHSAKAIQAYRVAVMTVSKDSRNFDAILAMALLLTILTIANQQDEKELFIAQSFSLYKGLNFVERMKRQSKNDPSLKSYIKVTKLRDTSDHDPKYLLEEPRRISISLVSVIRMEPEDPDYGDLKVLCRTLHILGELYISLREEGLGGPFFARVLHWPYFAPLKFTSLVEKGNPRALVICAYYLSFVKLVSGLWWAEGLANSDIPAIYQQLGPVWHQMLDVPLQITRTENKQEIVDLLLQ